MMIAVRFASAPTSSRSTPSSLRSTPSAGRWLWRSSPRAVHRIEGPPCYRTNRTRSFWACPAGRVGLRGRVRPRCLPWCGATSSSATGKRTREKLQRAATPSATADRRGLRAIQVHPIVRFTSFFCATEHPRSLKGASFLYIVSLDASNVGKFRHGDPGWKANSAAVTKNAGDFDGPSRLLQHDLRHPLALFRHVWSSLVELRMLSMAETIISENAITNGVRSPLFKGVFRRRYTLYGISMSCFYGIRKPESNQWFRTLSTKHNC